ncbi:MAG: hypothetical protein ABI457_09050, partial [Hyphomicrobium sp.]
MPVMKLSVAVAAILFAAFAPGVATAQIESSPAFKADQPRKKAPRRKAQPAVPAPTATAPAETAPAAATATTPAPTE